MSMRELRGWLQRQLQVWTRGAAALLDSSALKQNTLRHACRLHQYCFPPPCWQLQVP